jgi:hypothetical protein
VDPAALTAKQETTVKTAPDQIAADMQRLRARVVWVIAQLFQSSRFGVDVGVGTSTHRPDLCDHLARICGVPCVALLRNRTADVLITSGHQEPFPWGFDAARSLFPKGKRAPLWMSWDYSVHVHQQVS